ncbi:MAG: pyridine nucleotide-disulfide oxidoreductase [Firmicutes bacterium HGW-Firmicutes-1]|jgi:NADPH-dependent 2,4-dienoyl-CoA reductase/sulfur reductase-like enzyme/peroxiredoxin family protein/rhodanese-related sulfurtransferase/TusA-related sulfurtransferase|nr:MAG: pyridine nucleotide-disulfide oxidoreductase [Firmicutes bacterium HGW-Firmicutes-1]
MSKKVIIVGGVAGGASAAARLRRLDESIEIIMFERGPYISYANCGLPYYIGGTIKDRNALFVQTPEAMKARFNMDVRIQSEVMSINRETKTVLVNDLVSGQTYEESYDTLVLSPGSSPLRPKIPGIDSPNIFTLWTVPDTDSIKNYIDTHKVKTATVIGGGFIGIEMVENLHDLGIEVTLVEMVDQVLTPVDFEMAQIIHNHLSNQGIRLHLKNGVKTFSYNDGVTIVELQDGTNVLSDLVILSIGVTPNGSLAKDSGLDVNARGGIIVDPYLKTSDASIYAIGDAIEVIDYVNQIPTMIPLAGPANKQGRIVANNIVGRMESYEGTQGTSVAKVFDLTVATTGTNEKILNRLGKEYGKDYWITIVQPRSHAGYYPGAMPMTLKVIFDNDGKILGAQNVGFDGVEKRIDVIATAMRFGGTIYDLKKLELAYAPPYSSAKDPTNLAGFSAENILLGDQAPILWRELINLDSSESIILDIRENIEYELGAIENAIHIPINDLRERLNELPKDKLIVVYCAVGLRGYIAARILSENGFTVKNLLGGFSLYRMFYGDYTNPRCDFENIPVLGDDGAPEVEEIVQITGQTVTLNACGLQCPGPIMQVNSKIHELNNGDILEVFATDPGFGVDVQAWCKKTGNTFLKSEKRSKDFAIYIKKEASTSSPNKTEATDDSTMVVFSGDLDKALAAMIIANGAVAMGKKVTLFFTFWGLNILRKPEKVSVSKSLIEKMFGIMMPRGSKKLKLSKMNMSGMGTAMIKKVMNDKNVNSLEELIQSAMDSGIKFVACTMSMDLMGIKEEELIEGVEFGGVASYLGATEAANHNLFI